jgi:hypothetical protein
MTPSSVAKYYVKAYMSTGTLLGTSNTVAVNSGLSLDYGTARDGEQPERNVPSQTALSANYPNPFNPTTTIEYQLATSGFVTLKLYNILGEEVARLVDEGKDVGYYTATWNANNNASGVYYLRMSVVDETGKQSYQSVRKVVLMK